MSYQREARVLCQERGNDCVPDLRELRLVPYIIIADVMDIFCPFWDKIHLSRADKRIDACIFLAIDKPYQPHRTCAVGVCVCCLKVNCNII